MENQTTYREIPMLPLRGVLVFPIYGYSFGCRQEKIRVNAIEEAMMNNKEIFLATQKEAQTDEPEIDDIYAAGTIAEIRQVLKMPGGTMRVLVEGLHRAEVKGLYLPIPIYGSRLRNLKKTMWRKLRNWMLSCELLFPSSNSTSA